MTAKHLSLVGVTLGALDAATTAAIARFQQARGLPDTGECDAATWSALVESSWSLGARLLYLTSPHLRGDDVEQLQIRLARLGFHCGKADGIFGPRTAAGVTDFQRNMGLTVDGICGDETVRALERIGSQSGDGPGVVMVREAEDAHSGRAGRVAVAARSSRIGVARHVVRALRAADLTVLLIESDDAHAQARAANSFAAEVFVGIDDTAWAVTYYQSGDHSSPTGAALAQRIAASLSALAPVPLSPAGMRLPVLRETRMPAVVVGLGGPPGPEAAAAISAEVVAWASGSGAPT